MTHSKDTPAGFETVTEAAPSAPWLTMVHGMAQDRRVFSAQVAAFRDRFRLLLVDLPGHGLSSSLPGPYGLEEYAAGARAALEAAGVERTHFWGTHTGAGVGLLLACREPSLFASLVLEGPVLPGRLPPAVVEMMARVGELARGEGLEAALEHWWEHAGWFAVMREHPQATRAAEHRRLADLFQGGPWLDTRAPAQIAPIEPLLAQLRLPVLILNGEHDLDDFQEVAEALMGMLPDARRSIIAGGGGFPLWEKPEAVNAEVGTFLEEAVRSESPS